MKLNSKDIELALELDDLEEPEEIFIEGKTLPTEIGKISNRIQKIRHAVANKHEDTNVYGNKDKSRIHL